MNNRLLITLLSFLVFLSASGQTDNNINNTDQLGRKQGEWIKKYPDGRIQYRGFFRDDHPVGEFIRYYNNGTKMSLQNFSEDGKKADATLYHPNGFISSQGTYKDQLKEGTWKFYSAATEGYLINEEEYTGNLRNGLSVKYFSDGNVAERTNYSKGKTDGEWIKYHRDGQMMMRAVYAQGQLNGKYETWYENGNKGLTGAYQKNLKEGKWMIYNQDGTLRHELDYVAGITDNKELDTDAAHYLDSLEKNSRNIPDPEKTGVIR